MSTFNYAYLVNTRGTRRHLSSKRGMVSRVVVHGNNSKVIRRGGVRKSGARKFSGGTHGSHVPRQSGEEAKCIGSCCLRSSILSKERDV